ncbi:MAG TPA: hypothetical protein VFH51_03620, partial [Myxococcota bacterium]|nr:hypothetical protein [Myxococcota bacterium]
MPKRLAPDTPRGGLSSPVASPATPVRGGSRLLPETPVQPVGLSPQTPDVVVAAPETPVRSGQAPRAAPAAPAKRARVRSDAALRGIPEARTRRVSRDPPVDRLSWDHDVGGLHRLDVAVGAGSFGRVQVAIDAR